MSTYSTPNLFQAFLFTSVLCLGMSWWSIKIARNFRILDIPDSAPHKKHLFPTPLAGGIALMLSLTISAPVFGLWRVAELRAVILSAAIIFLFGLRDDLKGMSAPMKFIGQTIAIITLMLSGIHIKIFENPDFFISGTGDIFVWMDWIFTFVWLIGITNAFNLVDSMDGLAVGLSSGAFLFFALATIESHQSTLCLLSVCLLGICSGLSFFNKSPAQLFLGDSGSQTLGFLIATIGILYTPIDAFQTSSWFVPILLVAIPIFDTVLVIVSRTRRGKPFYRSDLDHTYHRLVYLGMDPGRAVLGMHLTALLLDCIAFIAVSTMPLLANGIFMVCMLAGVIGIFIFDNPKRWPIES